MRIALDCSIPCNSAGCRAGIRDVSLTWLSLSPRRSSRLPCKDTSYHKPITFTRSYPRCHGTGSLEDTPCADYILTTPRIHCKHAAKYPIPCVIPRAHRPSSAKRFQPIRTPPHADNGTIR
jgi:hypothetical protein